MQIRLSSTASCEYVKAFRTVILRLSGATSSLSWLSSLNYSSALMFQSCSQTCDASEISQDALLFSNTDLRPPEVTRPCISRVRIHPSQKKSMQNSVSTQCRNLWKLMQLWYCQIMSRRVQENREVSLLFFAQISHARQNSSRFGKTMRLMTTKFRSNEPRANCYHHRWQTPCVTDRFLSVCI